MMNVGDIVTTDLVSVAPDTPFKEVVERLIRSNVSGVPVVDDRGKLVDLITEADLISQEAYGGRRRAISLLVDALSARDHHWLTKAAGSEAGDVMTRNVIGAGRRRTFGRSPGDDSETHRDFRPSPGGEIRHSSCFFPSWAGWCTSSPVRQVPI